MGWRDLWDPERGLLPNDEEFQRAKTYLGDAWKGAGNVLMQGVGVAAGALPGGWKGLTTMMRGGSLDEAVKNAQATTMAIAEPITGAFAQETGQGGRDLERAVASRFEGYNDITSGIGNVAEEAVSRVPVVGPSVAPWVAGAAKTAADFAPVSPASWVEGAQSLARKAAGTNQWGVVVPPKRRGLPFASARRENPGIVEQIPADLRSSARARALDEAAEKKLGKGEPPPPPVVAEPNSSDLAAGPPPPPTAPVPVRKTAEPPPPVFVGDPAKVPQGISQGGGVVYRPEPGVSLPPQPRVFPGLREDIIPLGSRDAGELTLGQMEPGYVGVHPYSAENPNQYVKLPNGKFMLIHKGQRGVFKHGEGPKAGQPMSGVGAISRASHHPNIDLLQVGRLPEWEGYKPPAPPEPIPQQSMVKATREGQVVDVENMRTGEFGRPPHKETDYANIYHKGPEGAVDLYKRAGEGMPLRHKAGIRQGEAMRVGSVTDASNHPGFELTIIGRDPPEPRAGPARFEAGAKVRLGDLVPGEGFEGNNGAIYIVEPNGRFRMVKAEAGVGFRHAQETNRAMKEGESSLLDQTINRDLKKAYVPPDEVARIAAEGGYGPPVGPAVPDPVVEKAAQLAAEKGGMTMLLGKGAKPEAIAEHGWAYVPAQGHEKVLSHAPGAGTMEKFLGEQKKYVKKLGEWGEMEPQPALGDWKSSGGRHHLEIGVVAKPEEKAMALRKAQEAKQRALYHLSAGEEVPVPPWKIPGTGGQASMLDLGEGEHYGWEAERQAKRAIADRGGNYNPLAAQKILEKETPGRILESREVERNVDVGGRGGAVERQPSAWGTGQPLVANVDRAEKVYQPPALSENDFGNRPVLPGMADPRQKQFWRQGEAYRPQGGFAGGYFGRVEKPADHTAALAAEAKEQIKAQGGVQKPAKAKAINALLEQADDAALPREARVELGGPGGVVDAEGNPVKAEAWREVEFNPGTPEGQDNLEFMREVLREYAGRKMRADRRAADLSPYHTPGGGARPLQDAPNVGPNDLKPKEWSNIEARRGPLPEGGGTSTATGQGSFGIPEQRAPGNPERAVREAMERQRPSEERQRLWNIMRDERVDPSWTRLPYEEGGPKHRWKGEGKLGDQPVYGSAHTDRSEARAAYERRYGEPPRRMTEGDYDKPLSGTTLERVAKEAKENVNLNSPPANVGRPNSPDYLWGRTTKFMEKEAAKIDALEIAEPGKPVAGKELPPELAKALESPTAEKEFEALAGEERARQMKKFSIAGTGMKNTGRFSNGAPDPRFPAGQVRYFHDWRRGHLNWEVPGGYGRYMEPDGIRGAPPGWENGFVTKDGRFVTREQWEEIVGGRYSEHGKDGQGGMGTTAAANEAKKIEADLKARLDKQKADEEAKIAGMTAGAKERYLKDKQIEKYAWEVKMGLTQLEGGVPEALREEVAKKAGVRYKPKKKK